MKLLSLELQNFRQHQASEILFQTGLTGIVGQNGAGKTTIVEAISFALFGSRAIRGKVDELRTRGSREELTVTLSFEHDGGTYRVVRTTSDAELYAGGGPEPIVSGNRDVAAKISAILGMNHEEFIATFLTEQKGLEFLSGTKGATEREKFIVRMMGYDRLEKVQDLLREERREKRAELLGMEAGLGSREELEALLERERSAIGAVQAAYEEQAAIHEKMIKEEETSRVLLEARERVRATWLKLKQKLSETQVRSDEHLKRLKSLEVEKNSILETNVNGVLLRDLFTRAPSENSLEEIRAKIRVVQNQMVERERTLRTEEEKWKGELLKVKSEREMLSKRQKEIELREKRFSTLKPDSDCPTCGQELGESYKKVRESLTHELQDLVAQKSDIEAVLKKVEIEPEHLKDLRSTIASCLTERGALEEEVRSLESVATHRYSFDRIQKELTNVRNEIVEIDSALQKVRQEIVELHFSEEEYLSLKGRHDAAQGLVGVSRGQKQKVEGELDVKRALLARTERDLSQFDERKEKLQSLRIEVLRYDEADKAATAFRKALNEGIRPRLAELASDYIGELTDGRYTRVELGEDFTPTVVEDGEAKPVISGGESDILNLAVRLALSNMLAERAGQTFSLLILDEVFGSLDEHRRGNVLLLLDRLKERFEQILIITHMDDIREGVENILVLQFNEGTGSAEVTEGSDEYEVAV